MAQKRRTRASMLAETRAKLIAVARQMFGEKGYAETAMEDLTAAASLTRGALYHHFEDKKGLLQAVCDQLEEEFRDELSKIEETHEGYFNILKKSSYAYFELATHPEYQRIMLRDAPSVLGQPDPAKGNTKILYDVVERLMRNRIIGWRDPDAMGAIFNGALVYLAVSIANAKDPKSQLAKAISAWEMVLDGLLTTAPEQQEGAKSYNGTI